jgi:putative DNA primase/helicase
VPERTIWVPVGRMPSPEEVRAALSAVSGGNLSTGLDFLLQQALTANNPALCYLPEGVSLIRALAASKGSEVRDAAEKLRAKYGKDFRVQRFKSDVAEIKGQLSHEAATEQPGDFVRTEAGKIIPGHENAYQFFKNSPAWDGVLGYDEFSGYVVILKPPPHPISAKLGKEIDDTFDIGATRWLERQSGQAFRVEIVHWTIEILARENTFHSVRAYLEGLPAWDGTGRVSTWLADYCGADPGSDERPAPLWFGRMFLISAVARIMQPGCKVDHMLILEGKTGMGKSTAVAALVPNEEWFTDQLSDLSSKDASQELRGVWIIEFADLDRWSKADENTAKPFVSRKKERYRPPYGRRLTTAYRQCVFLGTTEKETYSNSETMRRQWPVRCTAIDVEGLRRDRDQIWAEAAAAFKAGERWHPDREQSQEAATEQRKRFDEDVWTDVVLRKAEELLGRREDQVMHGLETGPACVTISEVLHEATGMTLDRMKKYDKDRVASILRMNGWNNRTQKRLAAGSPSKVWRKG